VWWYYITELSFYWGLFFSQFVDVRRKDFWVINYISLRGRKRGREDVSASVRVIERENVSVRVIESMSVSTTG